MENLKKVIEDRKKIFECKKYQKYQYVLDILGIPEEFNYKDCIPKVFLNKNYEEIKKFKVEPYEEIYKEMIKHAKEKEFILGKEIIILVHPFYPLIRHANFLIEYPQYYKRYREYENKLLKILNNPSLNIILFESPDNFARYTYKFYDEGSVKKVVFTEHSTGIVLNNEDLIEMKEYKNIKIAGCYGENCIADVEKQLKGVNFTRQKNLIMERAIKL